MNARPDLRHRLLTLGVVAAAVAATASPAQATRYGNHDVHGSIEQEYLAEGGPTGGLRLPLTDELVAPDGVGRYNDFQGGSIYWSPASGAGEVQGAIRQRWAALGGVRGPLGYPADPLGHPSTHETVTPDGVGHVSYFQGGDIYFTPGTGALEVRGSILKLWASLDYEKSTLGYPISGEYDVPGGRRSDFQGGHIVWTPAGGITAQLNIRTPTGPSAPVPAGTVVLTGGGSTTIAVPPVTAPVLAHLHTTRSSAAPFGVNALPGSTPHPPQTLAAMTSGYDAVVPLNFETFWNVPTTSFQVLSDTTWEIDLIPLAATGTFGKHQTIGESRGTVWRYVGDTGTARITSNNASGGVMTVYAYDADTRRQTYLTSGLGAFDTYVSIKANQYIEIQTGPQFGALPGQNWNIGTWAITVI